MTPTICANQDLIQAIAKRNPERFQVVLTKILPLDLHIDFNSNFEIILSNFCKITNEVKQETGKYHNNGKVQPYLQLLHVSS